MPRRQRPTPLRRWLSVSTGPGEAGPPIYALSFGYCCAPSACLWVPVRRGRTTHLRTIIWILLRAFGLRRRNYLGPVDRRWNILDSSGPASRLATKLLPLPTKLRLLLRAMLGGKELSCSGGLITGGHSPGKVELSRLASCWRTP